MTLIDLISDVIKKMNDPFSILAVAVIGGLFYLLLKKEKTISDLRICLDTNIAESNETMVRLVTLVEALFYGKGGAKP